MYRQASCTVSRSASATSFWPLMMSASFRLIIVRPIARVGCLRFLEASPERSFYHIAIVLKLIRVRSSSDSKVLIAPSAQLEFAGRLTCFLFPC